MLIYATPTNRIFDWHIITDFDENYVNSEFSVNVNIKNYQEKTVSLQLKGEVWRDNSKIASLKSEDFMLMGNTSKNIVLNHIFENPLKWTAETPNLYKLKLLLYSNDNLVDDICYDFGFKETKIQNGAFYLNGVPIKVNAVNSHMQDPNLGHAVKEETVRKDLELVKQFNFNAIRISHYPPHPKYLELANEYGIYIIDEAGVEAHATEWVSNDPRFTDMYRERVR